MIRIHPEIEVRIKCNSCGQEFSPVSFHLTGMHVLCSGICPICEVEELFMEMPASAGLFYPTIIRSSDGERVDDMPFSNWFIRGLSNAYKSRSDKKITIEKRINNDHPKERLLILNTIDQTYGHSLLNLFNISYYRRKTDFHLLVVIQREMLWLLPDSVDEVWIVDISFSKAGNWYQFLEEEINEKIGTYSEASLCRAFPQAAESDFNIEEYSRIKPFPLDLWDERLVKPTVTFIWRTDRFWKQVLPRCIDNRVSRKIFPELIQMLKRKIQFKWILKFAEELRKKAPGVDFGVAGMDTRDYRLPLWINDYRYSSHNDESAKDQCRRYAESHLVIGCNGSSLVLPSCHAGAVMNIVPRDGWMVSVGSFHFRYTSLADTFFRYSLIPAESSIERIVKIAVQILRDRSMVQIVSGSPWNDHDSGIAYGEWAKFRKGIFGNTAKFNEEEGMISR